MVVSGAPLVIVGRAGGVGLLRPDFGGGMVHRRLPVVYRRAGRGSRNAIVAGRNRRPAPPRPMQGARGSRRGSNPAKRPGGAGDVAAVAVAVRSFAADPSGAA